MKHLAISTALSFLFCAASWVRCLPVIADEVVAILSSDSLPYEEALAGFRETFPTPVQVQNISKGELDLPASAKIVVTFGGKAATQPYPDNVILIDCVAPGLTVRPDSRRGRHVKIRVLPPPEAFLSGLKAIQPKLARLGMIWISPTFGLVLTEHEAAARAHGIHLVSERLRSPEEFPSRLRALQGKVDALWMPPDPVLMTPTNFQAAEAFGRANNIPLYVPMDKLADKGAAASIWSSFRDQGRMAGKIAAQAVSGQMESGEYRYPEKSGLTLNLTAAAQSGLTIPAEVIKRADRVVP